jgi:DNA-directed RNA polymerase specialized sigma24 family protein
LSDLTFQWVFNSEETMTDSQTLLAEYARTGSEAAFQRLVALYLDLVYSVAIRLVGGNPNMAEDVAQTVFIDLARMAKGLSGEVRLGGWLHRHTCFVASKAMRGERRRQTRERQAVEMSTLHDHTEGNLAWVAPMLAGFHASDDPALLQEAMQGFPNDLRVDFAAALRPGASPEEQRQWLNAFEQSAPDNALANYLSALNYFRAGQTDQAAQELTAAAGKELFENYARDSMQNDVEAYLAAGFSMADAKVFGAAVNPQTAMNSALRELGQDMVGLASAYQQSGDPASAQAAFQMTVGLGQRLDVPEGATAVSGLVGMIIERTALNAMDPASPFGDSGQTVQEQINQITQNRAALMDLGNQFNAVAPMMSDQDWINYRDREWAVGQKAAQQWAITKYGQHGAGKVDHRRLAARFDSPPRSLSTILIWRSS